MKLEIVQSLRGLAAIMVVLFHFKVFIEPVAPGVSHWFSHGYLGVDVFFVLSGFIIYVSTEEGAARQSQVFLLRRFCRVVLPAWAAMAVAAVAKPPHLNELLYGFLFIPLHNATPPYFGYSFLIVAWTLTYELIFYSVFAAVLALPLGRKHRGLCASAALLGLVYGVQLLARCCTLDPQQGPLIELPSGYLPGQLVSLLGNPILLEFIVGIVLGWAYLQGAFRRVTLPMLLLAAPGVFYLIISLQFTPGHGLTRGGLLGAAIVVLALAAQACWDKRLLRPASGALAWWRCGWVWVFLGDISYSLYLLHPSIKATVARYDGRHLSLSLVSYGKFIFALLCTLAAAIWFYKWVEMPAQRLGRNMAGRWVSGKAAVGGKRPA